MRRTIKKPYSESEAKSKSAKVGLMKEYQKMILSTLQDLGGIIYSLFFLLFNFNS